MKNRLIKILSKFTYDDIEKIEKTDPQFIAIKKLYHKIQEPEKFIRIVLVNALISYQLQTTGENYWQIFSNYFSKDSRSLSDFYDFIEKHNKRLLSQRKKRLDKVLACVKDIDENLLKEINPLLLREKLSKCLHQKEDAKTIVFAIKMYLYSLDIVHNKHHISPLGIMIPLDSRIKKISKDKKFWTEIEEKTKIPLLHIDSIIWNAMNSRNKQYKELHDFLEELSE